MSDFNSEALNPLNDGDINRLGEILREPYFEAEYKYFPGQVENDQLYRIREKGWRAKLILNQSQSMFARHHKAQSNKCYKYIMGQISVAGFEYLEPEIRKLKEEAENDYLEPSDFLRDKEINQTATNAPNIKEHATIPDKSNDWLDKPINRNIIFPILIGLFLVFVAALIVAYSVKF